MSEHKFGVGEKVDFVPAFHQRSAPTTEYQIVRQLPDHNGEFFYQIKSAREPHDRVVGESQLVRPASPVKHPPPRAAKRRAKPSSKRAPARPRAARTARPARAARTRTRKRG
ncbi:MAG TPA: hypothetical protein VF913_19220 [Xanthobacteraceae bacterium]